jgi:ABC-2 type transport system permease protein
MSMVMGQAILETKLFLRAKASLFWTFVFPIMFMGLFGLIYKDTKWAGMEMRSVDYLLPGIVTMGVMVTGIMYLVQAFVAEREKGIFRRMALTPMKRQWLVGGQMVHYYAVIVVQTLLLMALGVAAFNIKISGNMFLFWLVLSAGAASFMSIGFALTCVAKTVRSASVVAQMPYFIFMFLGGIFFPTNMLPKALGYVANALPSTNMNDALRAIFFQGAGIGDVWQHLLVMAAWTVACFAVSIRFFRWE